MELQLKKQPLFISEVLLETTSEQPIECDALLPDYCPDIVRILKCVVTPNITTKYVANQRLNIEGVCQVVVYYTANVSGIFKAEYKLPFSKAMELKEENSKLSIWVSKKLGYVNCRAVNQRRLDIRGAITLGVKVIGSKQEMVVVGGEGAGIQLRDQCKKASYLVGEVCRDIRIEEEVELTYGKVSVKDIIRCTATPKVVDYSASEGKVMVKGELDVHLFYKSTDDTYEHADFVLPTVLLVEQEGASADCMIQVCKDITYCNLEILQDSNGEPRIISIQSSVMCVVKVDCEYQPATCIDCYSTKGKCSFKVKEHNTLSLVEQFSQLLSVREAMAVPDDMECVLDFWCETNGINLRQDDDKMFIDGRVNVSLICKMTDGEIYYFDKTMDVEHMIHTDCASPILTGDIAIVTCGYNFSGNDSIDIKCDLSLHGEMYQQVAFTGVDEISIEEGKFDDVAMPSGLYLYRRAEGELLWDIAKRYQTSVARIEEENPEDGELWTNGILLVPVV